MASRVHRLLWLCLALAPPGTAEASPFFTGLGRIAGESSAYHPWAMSADGSTVVGDAWSVAAGGDVAWRWTAAAGLELLPSLPGTRSATALDTSADGSVMVGRAATSTEWISVMWTPAGVSPTPARLQWVRNVSADGSVLAGTTISGEPAIWSQAGGLVYLGGPLPGFKRSAVHEISADGSVVVGHSWKDRAPLYPGEAFHWTAASGMVGLGTLGTSPPPAPGLPPLTGSAARGVSADGSVIVGSTTAATGATAYRWTEATGMVPLPVTGVEALSGDGSVLVGGVDTGEPRTRAYLWDERTGMRLVHEVLAELGIDTTGWELVDATDVSFDGRTITGWGFNPDGDSEAWIVFLPEPAPWVLLAPAAAALRLRRRLAGLG